MMDATARFIFEGAIDDQRTSMVSVSIGEAARSMPARFVSRDDEGFRFRAVSWPDAADGNAAQTVAFEFPTNTGLVQFKAEVLGGEKQGEGVLVRCANPIEVKVVQRRAHFRVPVPASAPISLTVWKIPSHWYLSDRPKPSAQLRAEIVDLSLGGICLRILPSKVNREAICQNDRLRMEMRFENSEAIFDGLIAYRCDPDTEGVVRVGVAFQKMETSIEGRRGASLLDRVIATLQRNALKETAVA